MSDGAAQAEEQGVLSVPAADMWAAVLIQAVGPCELHAFFSYRWMTKRYGARRD